MVQPAQTKKPIARKQKKKKVDITDIFIDRLLEIAMKQIAEAA